MPDTDDRAPHSPADPATGTAEEADPFGQRLGLRLQALRQGAGLTLDDLAQRTGISRATLSRIERGETSPTAQILGRLAAVYNRPTSRLIADAETVPARHVPAAAQIVWTDPATGFRRRMVSPPAPGNTAEMLDCEIPAGRTVAYDAAPVVGLEQHLYMQGGRLDLTEDDTTHALHPGDSLRFHLTGGPTRFHAPGPEPARYILVLVRPHA
jgi:transcriptional regulator with XRE-family HTH domain